MRAEVLSVKNLTFSNSAGRVLSNISFHLYRGEILGIVGINGVGKTVLAQLLAGLLPPESGKIVLEEGAAAPGGAGQELLRGMVGYVGEEPQLIENLTVAENLVLGVNPRRRLYYSRRHLYNHARQILAGYHFTVNPLARVSTLSYAQMKEVQLARQLSSRPEVLILDEVADAFSDDALSNLQKIFHALTGEGTSIIYTSHNYEDVMRFATRILVLRGAAIVAELPQPRFERKTLRRIIYGGDPTASARAEPEAARVRRTDEQPAALRVCNLQAGDLKPVSFAVQRGEILGIAGMVNSGKSLVSQCIGGHLPAERGQIFVRGVLRRIRSPRDAIKSGIGLCMEKRSEMLLGREESISMDISLGVIERIGSAGILSRRRERLLAEEYCKQLGIQRRPEACTATLNNADLTKIALARCMAANPGVLVLDEPNRELDIEGVRSLCGLLDTLRKSCGIILLFSKIDDLALCCDRVLVMHAGEIIGELGKGAVSYSAILRMVEERRSRKHD